jgi:hypothetical protein
VPGDCIFKVMHYLDPYSLAAFSLTGSMQHKVFKSESMGDYYKSLCVKLFKPGPVSLPAECRFLPIRTYVQEHLN